MTALPPGSSCGQRWLGGSSDLDLNNGSGVPPAADTLIKVVTCELSGANMILPSSDQSPPRPLGASHNVIAVPPLTGIFFSLPGVKNPTHSPSGEKNGLKAPSVPGKGAA